MRELPFAPSARSFFESLFERPCAPKFNFQSSDLLDDKGLQEVKDFERDLAGLSFWKRGELPDWMDEFLQRIVRQVPFYRDLGSVPPDFASIPSTCRQDLAFSPELFVPDDMALEALTVYTTSGTTGSALSIPTDAPLASKVLVLIDRLLARYAMRLPRGSGRLALAVLYCQRATLTYPSLSHYLEGAATLKLNLHPGAWRDPEHRGAYLEELCPAVITASPGALSALLECCPQLRPQAILSSAQALSEGLAERLKEVFHCPVIDVYSLTEAKFIAAKESGGHDCHRLISPDLYLEILDPLGRPVDQGERGEITVSGGRNRYLPLLRYRTGDYASLDYRAGQPVLVNLEGRSPVEFLSPSGEAFPSLDVVHALQEFPLVGFSFVQACDLSYRLDYCGEVDEPSLKKRLSETIGLDGQAFRHPTWEGKPLQFATGSEP